MTEKYLEWVRINNIALVGSCAVILVLFVAIYVYSMKIVSQTDLGIEDCRNFGKIVTGLLVGSAGIAAIQVVLMTWQQFFLGKCAGEGDSKVEGRKNPPRVRREVRRGAKKLKNQAEESLKMVSFDFGGKEKMHAKDFVAGSNNWDDKNHFVNNNNDSNAEEEKNNEELKDDDRKNIEKFIVL